MTFSQILKEGELEFVQPFEGRSVGVIAAVACIDMANLNCHLNLGNTLL
jgi:hypothetical protein